MNKDNIIRMAREAAAKHGYTIRPTDEIVETLTSFAALVAAAEREDCAKLCENEGSNQYATKHAAAAIRSRGKK